jgi:hypothetical protein
MDNFLAFRCMGKFVWPPVSKVASKTGFVEGVVEIHYLKEKPGDANWTGCIRWIGRSEYDALPITERRLGKPLPPLGEMPQLMGMDDAKLAALFNDQANGTLTWRFDREAANELGDLGKLRFEGVSLLEQFDPSADAGAAPALRLPLVREHWQERVNGNTRTWYSSLQIGRDGEHLHYQLDIAFPLPLPADATQRKAGKAFCAMGFTYEGHPEKSKVNEWRKAKTPGFNAVLYGLRGKNSILDSADYSGRTLLELDVGLDDRPQFQMKVKDVLDHILPGIGVPVIARQGEDLERYFTLDTPYKNKGTARPFPGFRLQARTVGDGRPSEFAVHLRFALGADETVALSVRSPFDLSRSALALRSANGKRWIDLRTPDGEWAAFPREIYGSVTMRGHVGDADVWSGDFSVDVTVMVGGMQDMTAVQNMRAGIAPPTGQGGDTFPLMLAHVMAASNFARAGLSHLQPPNPQSAMPLLQCTEQGAAARWKHFGLFARLGGSAALRPGGPVLDREMADALRGGFWASLQTDDVIFRSADRALIEISFDATWSSLVALGTVAKLVASHHAVNGWGGPDYLQLKFTSGLTGPGRSRLGGLSFTHSVQGVLYGKDEKQPSVLSIGKPPPGRPELLTYATARYCAVFHFAIDQVDPLGVDLPRFDRTGRGQPLVMRLDNNEPGDFGLVVTEILNGSDEWHLTAELLERVQSTNKDNGGRVLLSEQPFAFHRFYSQPLEARGNQGNVTVAKYDSDTGAWLVVQVARVYAYTLPPQSIGESMDKPRRLELHDTELGAEEFLRPYPPEPGGTAPTGIARRAVEFRLPPPAQLWIRPSDVQRAYAPPEWASREIFRQHGELGLGAALDAFRGEFVYGLAVGIRPDLERGPSRRARVAEIEALTGRIMDKVSGNQDEMEARWSMLHEAFQRRPERLELWADDPDSTIPFAPARFTRGASFALRTTALHRPAVHELEPALGAEGPGRPVQRVPGLSPRLHPLGLSGGALWPIESRNVLKMVLDNPASTGGSIESVALSPLGGDADQTARFCNGRVAIITETRGGYVQRQRVEVIGRIGAWWHRAKHVVIYERTVNPSAQFAPDPDESVADKVRGERTRRPVLRKVSEFIEVLQAERRYPDFPNVEEHTRAFLRGMRFNNPVIPVDSAWGEDVGDIGWKVPLWNRHAALIRPQVYRMPDVAFLCAAEGKDADAESGQGCLNPELFHFYADTTLLATDATDTWAEVLSVDWTNQLRPMPSGGQSEQDKALESARTANAPQVPRGYESFTWRLAPPARRATINEARGKDPVYASIETLTFMRAGPVAQVVDGAAAQAMGKADVLLALETAPDAGKVWRKGKTFEGGAKPLADLSVLMARLGEMQPDTLPDAAQKAELKAAFEEFKKSVSNLPTALKPDLTARFGTWKAASGDLLGAIGNVDPKALIDPKMCQRLIDDLKTSVTAKSLSVMQQMQAWESEVARLLDTPVSFSTRDELVEKLHDPFKKAIKPLFSAASVEVGKLYRGFETTRGTVVEVRARLKQELLAARKQVDAARLAIDEAKPWSQKRVEDFHQSLLLGIDRMQAQADGIVDDARGRLSTGLDRLAQGIGNITSLALKQVLQGEGALKSIARSPDVQTRIGRLSQLKRAIDELLDEEGPNKGAIAELKALAEKPELTEFRDRIIAAADAIRASLNDASSGLAAVPLRYEDFAKQFDADVAHTAELARGALTKAQAEAGELLKMVETELGNVADDIVLQLAASAHAARVQVGEGVERTLAAVAKGTALIDQMEADVRKEIERCMTAVDGWIDEVTAVAEEAIADARAKVAGLEDAVGPDKLEAALNQAFLKILDELLDRLQARWAWPLVVVDDVRSQLLDVTSELVTRIEAVLRKPGELVDSIAGPIQAACSGLSDGIRDAVSYLKGEVDPILNELKERFEKGLGLALGDIDGALDDLDKYRKLVRLYNDCERDLRRIGNDMAAAVEVTRAWGENVVSSIGNLGEGGVLAVPSNVLRALAAWGDGPELPNLELARAKIGYYYDEFSKYVDITPVEAFFGRMGEGLKPMGLCLPISGIEGYLKSVDTQMFDIGYIVRKCGGAELERMCRGYTMPASMRDAVKVTHGFDRKSMRAWVQVDMNIKLEGRRSLFSFGPFTLDILNASLTGKLRIDATQDGMTEEGSSMLQADFAAVVGGQTMVTLQETSVNYDKASGLQVNFDAKKIKLNQGLQFIQNTLGSIFADEVGGLKIIKENGLPIGLEHLFTMPPMSLMFGTSGVQNIQITNQFQLIAYPDFLLSNRFSLAKPELPFLFTVFIIGGTGWLTVDVEYRPFKDELMVVVDAGAGGSASLAFAVAGCVGSVAITISIALTYRKLIGRSGGGLTISVVVLIVGVVDVLRIASAVITVMLRLAYSENGDINATGSFSITIRISRFFKISAGGQAQYRMSGGKSESSSSTSASAGVDFDKAQKLARGRKG